MTERMTRAMRERLIGLIQSAIADKGDGETVFADELADKLIEGGVIVTPHKPRPVIKDENPYGSDVYCPYCGSNQSGQYGGTFGYSAPRFVACFSCGEYLDLAHAYVMADEEGKDG